MRDRDSLVGGLLLDAKNWQETLDLAGENLTAELLAQAPLIPLWMATQKMTPDTLALALPLMSSEQRTALIDLDQWDKDHLKTSHLEFWMKAYAQCPSDEVVAEFIQSEPFFLYLKSTLHISTFDCEDPQYPDDDNYFLSDDGLLIFEYDEDFSVAEELRSLIRRLYAELGVDFAYPLLFKLVADNFMAMEENSYQAKKNRLEEFGVVDYYDSLEYESTFSGLPQIHQFLLKAQERVTPGVPDQVACQILNAQQLKAFLKAGSSLHEELSKVVRTSRSDFLRFNFIKFLNARLSFTRSSEGSRLDLLALGRETLSQLDLGLEYARSFLQGKILLDEGLFSLLTFSDCYRVGKSLMLLEQRKLKKQMALSGMDGEDQEKFLAREIGNLLDSLFSSPPEFFDFFQDRAVLVDNLEKFRQLQTRVDFVCQLLPFVKKLHENFLELKKSSNILDHYFMNYKVDEIDVESIFCSGLVNFVMAFDKINEPGQLFSVQPEHVMSFAKTYFSGLSIEDGPRQDLQAKAQRFIEHFGLAIVPSFADFLIGVLNRELSGNDWQQLTIKDLTHIGGPLIMQNL